MRESVCINERACVCVRECMSVCISLHLRVCAHEEVATTYLAFVEPLLFRFLDPENAATKRKIYICNNNNAANMCYNSDVSI